MFHRIAKGGSCVRIPIIFFPKESLRGAALPGRSRGVLEYGRTRSAASHSITGITHPRRQRILTLGQIIRCLAPVILSQPLSNNHRNTLTRNDARARHGRQPQEHRRKSIPLDTIPTITTCLRRTPPPLPGEHASSTLRECSTLDPRLSEEKIKLYE